MAGIEFKVDAVLGDVDDVQNLIDTVNKGATLNIDNKQALQSIQAVQQQIDALKQSMNNMNFNFGGGRTNSNSSTNPIIPNLQQTQSQLKNIQGDIVRIKTVNGEWASTTVKGKQGWTEVSKTITATGKEIDTVSQKTDEFAEKLKWVTGDAVAKDVHSVSDITNTDWFKNLGDGAEIVGGVNRSLNAQNQQIEKTTVRIKTADNQWQKYNATVNTTTGELRVLKGQTSDVVNSQMNLSNMLTSAIERFAVWGVAMKFWTGLKESISNCINYVKDLDSAMTNIRVVTMDTKEATDGLLKSYNQIGQELGASTTDIAEGAVDWLNKIGLLYRNI